MISLRLLLALCLAGLQMLSVVLIVFSSYVASERALIRHAQDLLSRAGQSALHSTRTFLEPAQRAAGLTADLLSTGVIVRGDMAKIEAFLFTQLVKLPEVSALYYGTVSGDFIFVMRNRGDGAPYRSKLVLRGERGRHVIERWRAADYRVVDAALMPDDDYDPRTRQWFQRSQQAGAPAWSDPYIFFSSRAPGVSFGHPVYHAKGDLAGVVGLDIEISALSQFLASLGVGENGRAIMLDEAGDVIAHPEAQLSRADPSGGALRLSHISEIGDPVADAAFGDAGRHAEETTGFAFGPHRYVALLTPPLEPQLPWRVGVWAPESDFTGLIKAAQYQTLWIAGAIAVLSGLIGLYLAEVLHRPVRAFSVYNALLSEGQAEAEVGTPPRTYIELERANAALRRQIAARRSAESVYGQTVDLSPRAMAKVNPVDGRLLWVNPRFAAIFGEARDAFVGRSLSCLGLDMGEEGLHHGGQDLRWVMEDGREMWLRANMVVIRDNDNLVHHALLTLDDITLEKHNAAQLRQLTRDLSHLERGRSMGALAQGLAHELNQPLTAIAQNADALRSCLLDAGGRDPEHLELVDEIEAQALRAGDIIRTLRAFVRREPEAPSGFDLADLTAQTVQLLRAEIQEAGVTVVQDMPRPAPILGQSVQVAQVLLNLMRNSLEAMASAPPTAPRELRVSAREEGLGWRICVEDTGPGLAEGVALYSQFATSKPEGLGLGLNLCRSLVEAQGGRLWHDAPATGGARFSFTVPRMAPEGAAAAVETGAAARPLLERMS